MDAHACQQHPEAGVAPAVHLSPSTTSSPAPGKPPSRQPHPSHPLNKCFLWVQIPDVPARGTELRKEPSNAEEIGPGFQAEGSKGGRGWGCSQVF